MISQRIVFLFIKIKFAIEVYSYMRNLQEIPVKENKAGNCDSIESKIEIDCIAIIENGYGMIVPERTVFGKQMSE